MKKILAVLFAVMALFCFAACGPKGSGTTDLVENEDLPHMFAPVVKVSKTGLASWTDLEGAKEFAYKLNDGEEIKTSEHSVQLELNDTIVVKCLGDNVTRRDSRWSEEQTYMPPHSFAMDNSGSMGVNNLNIYKTDGTEVLNTIDGTKTYGDVLQTGVEYVFEFDITVGVYHNGLLLAGVEDAVIKDLTWSDSPYTAREGEKADTSDHFYEVNYNTKYMLYPDYPGVHRFDWSMSEEWGEITYRWDLLDDPAKNENGVYDTRADDFWTVEPNWCAPLYGAHFLGTGKSSREQTNAGYRYVRFTIQYDSFRPLSTGQVDGVEDYGALLGRENFNMFALVHQSMSYIFFDSNQTKEYEARENSFATDDNGEAASGVNIYDAESGELVLNAMTDSTATGSLLQANKEYIFEFDVRGTKNGAIIMSGFENALISDITWSDKLYSERAGESAIADTLRLVGLDTQHHHLAADEPLFHHIWKSGDGYTANFIKECTANGDGAYDTADSINRVASTSSSFNCCLSFARKQWFASGKTSAETNRQYFRMTVEYREIDTIDVGGVVTDPENPDYGTLAGTYFNSYVYTPAGGRYLYLIGYSPA